jgi:hypothetical protein
MQSAMALVAPLELVLGIGIGYVAFRSFRILRNFSHNQRLRQPYISLFKIRLEICPEIAKWTSHPGEQRDLHLLHRP